ncbi:hypothetical protein GCM10022409_26700 [Hymenobacter glaciei]|uniref:Uncharacterized protein n=1 Tax=Hymenobacter glaciei TaxID=877209 RepID=A0ABP7UB95_9BACT
MLLSFLRGLPRLLLLTGLLGSGAARAQSAARYRYWEAYPDSLRRVLAGQRADSARLRTLMHLADVAPLVGRDADPTAEETAEAAALSVRSNAPTACWRAETGCSKPKTQLPRSIHWRPPWALSTGWAGPFPCCSRPCACSSTS